MKHIEKLQNGRIRVKTINEEPSKTDQSWHKESDVNHIIQKFKKTGQLTHLANRRGMYADVSQIPDLQSALQIVEDSTKSFMTLPSDVRRKFMNDPKVMIEFLKDSKNYQEAVELGLLIPKENSDTSLGQKSKKSQKETTTKGAKDELSKQSTSTTE